MRPAMSQRINSGRALLRGVALTFGLSAFAALQPASATDYETATGVFCDSGEQAERFAVLFKGDTAEAVAQVNTEVKNDKACATMQVAFLRGETLGVVRSGANAWDIARILIIGVGTQQGMRQVQPFVQFTPFKRQEWMV